MTGRSIRPAHRAARKPRSRVVHVVTALVLAVVAVHMFFTGVVNTPNSTLKYEVLPGQVADNYVNPLLVQNYRIFAPNPASEDRALWVRAWIEMPDGERIETEWINATAVELAVTYRKVLRKHLTIQAAEQYMAAYRNLNDQQKEVLASGNFHNEHDRARLEALLSALGPAETYLRMDEYVTGYATQVALALYGDEAEILAVQSRAVYNPVPRWADRFDADAAPPDSILTWEGWRAPIVNPNQDVEAFGNSFREWLEVLEAREDAQ